MNFDYFQHALGKSGLIIGVDLSAGMLNQARKKIERRGWTNIDLILDNATQVDQQWLEQYAEGQGNIKVDAVFCDLGLSGLPGWQNIIDNMVSILSPNGRIVILDWYIERVSLWSKFIEWIGKGEVNRPLWQYLETKVSNFKVVDSFNRGGVFVASGTKP